MNAPPPIPTFSHSGTASQGEELLSGSDTPFVHSLGSFHTYRMSQCTQKRNKCLLLHFGGGGVNYSSKRNKTSKRKDQQPTCMPPLHAPSIEWQSASVQMGHTLELSHRKLNVQPSHVPAGHLLNTQTGKGFQYIQCITFKHAYLVKKQTPWYSKLSTFSFLRVTAQCNDGTATVFTRCRHLRRTCRKHNTFNKTKKRQPGQ